MGLGPVSAGTDLTAEEVNQLPVVVSALALGSVVSSSGETIIGTFTIPAGTITAANQGFRFIISGTCGGVSSPNLTLRIRSGSASGTIIATGTNAVSSAAGWWSIDGWLLFTTVGSSGTYNSLANLAENFSGTSVPLAQGFYSTLATVFNTTISVPIYVTAQFSASSASNTAATVAGNLYQL